MTRFAIRPAVAVIAAAALAAGCSSGPARGTVRGKVTLDDEPVTGASVTFENAELGVAVTAPLGDDGTYEVRTYEGPGLMAGSYQVTVRPGRPMQSAEEIPLAGKAPPKPPKSKAASPIPERYLKPATSGLTADVKKGDNPPFDFRLTK